MRFARSLRRRKFSWDSTPQRQRIRVHMWDKEARIGDTWVGFWIGEPTNVLQKRSAAHAPSLHMKDFRGTRELEIDFECDMTVIVGRNGTGKTSILDALGILIRFLCDYHDRSSDYRADIRHTLQDIRLGADNSSLLLNIDVGNSGPIKMRQFIFTHTSGPVPRHAVLGVGGCPNNARARQRPWISAVSARADSRAA